MNGAPLRTMRLVRVSWSTIVCAHCMQQRAQHSNLVHVVPKGFTPHTCTRRRIQICKGTRSRCGAPLARVHGKYKLRCKSFGRSRTTGCPASQQRAPPTLVVQREWGAACAAPPLRPPLATTAAAAPAAAAAMGTATLGRSHGRLHRTPQRLKSTHTTASGCPWRGAQRRAYHESIRRALSAVSASIGSADWHVPAGLLFMNAALHLWARHQLLALCTRPVHIAKPP